MPDPPKKYEDPALQAAYEAGWRDGRAPRRYSKEEIAQIRAETDVLGLLVHRYGLELRRVGQSVVALCPFHQEESPSFKLTTERGLWHCFGCGAGGDLVALVQRLEPCTFPEALQILRVWKKRQAPKSP